MEEKVIQNNIVKLYYPETEDCCIEDILKIIEDSYQKGLKYFGIDSLKNKIEIKIYSSIQELHQEEFGESKEEWLVCCGKKINKVVSPLHPGNIHNYDSILRIIAGIIYRTIMKAYTNNKDSIFETGMMIHLAGLERNTTTCSNPQISKFKQEDYFNFSDTYYIVIFLLLKYGKDKMLEILKKPNEYNQILQVTDKELDGLLTNFYQAGYRQRIRVAGIIPMQEGFAFIHRTNVQEPRFEVKDKENKVLHDYYVFSGGGLEDETLEEGVKREIKEELGITVEVKELLYTKENEKMQQYFFLCEYKEGVFGTGDGPEFNGDPTYQRRGNYIPVIVPEEKIQELVLVPYEIKEQLIADIHAGRFKNK